MRRAIEVAHTIVDTAPYIAVTVYVVPEDAIVFPRADNYEVFKRIEHLGIAEYVGVAKPADFPALPW